MSSTQDTIFPSPGTDASVIAMDVTENQDISLSSSDDPVPILASTAHKERAACDNVEMLNRIQQLAEMAGSYLDSRSESDIQESNRFSNYLKTDLPDNSSTSYYSLKSSLNQTHQTTSEESSLSMLDLEHMAAGRSLVPVESNISLGSWFGDVMPDSNKLPRNSENVSLIGTHSHDDEPKPSHSNDRFDIASKTPQLNSRYFMTDSQLGSFSDTPQGTPFRSIRPDIENLENTNIDNESHGFAEGQQMPQSVFAADVAAMCPDDIFLPCGDNERELAMSVNCFGADFGEVLNLQQEVFADEEFAGNIADILDHDEEKFEEDHRLMMDSNVQEESSSGMGFSTNDSPTKMEYFDPKLSIGTYMAARSDKMGKLDEDGNIERPSFGWKIRSPPSRYPVALQASSLKSDDTGDVTVASESVNSQDNTLTKDTTHDRTLEVQPSEAVDTEAKNQMLDTTTDTDSMSLTAAMMNMSTSVSNEDLARAIIEVAKQKQARVSGKNIKLPQDEPAAQDPATLSSCHSMNRPGGKPIRKSRIPVGVKSPSPPKPMAIKKNSYSKEIRQRKASDVTESRSSASSVTSNSGQLENAQSETSDVAPATLPEYSADEMRRTQQSIRDSTGERNEIAQKESDGSGRTGVATDVKATSSSSLPRKSTDSLNRDSTPLQADRSWNNLMQESFMHDNPEQDNADTKSASNEEARPFHDDRESMQFSHDISRDFLLSSTRTESSLLRGSLSRESIEELHKKLRVQCTTHSAKPVARVPSAVEKSVNREADRDHAEPMLNNAKVQRKDLNEDTSWKTKDFPNEESIGPLSQSSPQFQGDGRFSGDFHEMLPSMTMSFGEMATIQEHQFNLHDVGEQSLCSSNQNEHGKTGAAKIHQLDAITEEAETTQDTILSSRSSSSTESQIPSELSHPAQHSTTVAPPTHLQTMPPIHNPYLPFPHSQPRLAGSLSAASLPNLYRPESLYPRSMDGPHHSLPMDYFHSQRNANLFSHPYNRLPAPNPFTPHGAMHGSVSPFGFDQPSMALSSEMALNHTANTMYSQTGFMQPGVHAPRLPSSFDGRFTPYADMYHPQMQLRQFEGLTVPAELIFPQVRCVSLTSITKLPLKNNSERWLQADVNILSPTIDSCFSVDGNSKLIVGPHETKNIEILFLPKSGGQFEGIMEVASSLVTTDGSCTPHVRPVTALVNLRAIAENPKVELVGPDNKKMLDFGEVVCDGVKHLPLKIHNRGATDVPVCVIICSKSVDRRCFAITESTNIDWQDQEKRSQSVLRSMIYPGNHAVTFWVHCKIPPKYNNANEPPTNISAQVYLELDNSRNQSFDSVVLDTVAVEVVACVAKLHAPKNMQPLNFSCTRDSFQTVVMPVKNCGNISSKVAFDVQSNASLFEISPRQALLAPGEQVDVSIKFAPHQSTPNKIQTTFLMKIEPNGTKYEITINAFSSEPSQFNGVQRQCFTNGQSSVLNDMPSLLTNKSHLCWGGVAVGQSLQQRVVLRTSSGAKKPLPMRLMIKGSDAACFQILREDDRNREELCSRQEIVMLPGHDKIVRVLYGPTKCKIALAKLEIKAPVDQVPSTKFTIPLSGYGGRCDLKIDDLEALPKEDGKVHPLYVAYALSSEDDQILTVKFTVKNNSSRHAFVKTVLYSDRECVIPHPASNAASPSHFILPKQSSRVVQVSLAKTQLQRTGYTRDGKELIAALCLWYGEEIARHLLKNALGKFGPSAVTKCLSESNPLRNIAFDGIFEGESSLVAEEELEQVKPQFGDVQVFYSSIKKSTVEIFGPRTPKLLEMVEPGKTLPTTNISKATTSHMHYKRPSKVETTGNIWDISPEHVILSVPNLSDSTGPSKIKIINKSKNPLKFDAAWSRNYLTITPHCGHVDPESVLIILLNANPSLATRRDELPWIGTVQISTQSGRDTKQLHVQIRDDIAVLDSSAHPTLSSPHHQLKARYSEPLTLDSFSTPMAISGTSRLSEPLKSTPKNKILLPATALDFGSVPVRSSSKSHLEFTNVCPSTIRWILTSFAPAYVKSVESTGDLYRTTYAAFIFSHTSGLLETGVKVRIPVTFSPVSEGQYSQFWDLEHHDASDSAAVSLNKVRIQVNGQGIPSSKGTQGAAISAAKGKEMHGIYVSEGQVRFPVTAVNESAVIKIPVKNRSKDSHNVRFVNVRLPFHITHQRHTIRPMSYACLPVTFKPTCKGEFETTLVIQAEGMDDVSVSLYGRGV